MPAGVGIGLRRPHFDEIAARCHEGRAIGVDWFELVPENFIGRGGAYRRVLDACRSHLPLVGHGVSASLGGPDPLDVEHLEALGGLLQHIGSPIYSDHICYTQIGERGYYDLLPLPWNRDAAIHVGRRAARVAEILGRPLVLEHVSTYARMPGSDLDEATFLRIVLDTSGAQLLLDVNNLYINARNLGWDPAAALDAMPLDRVAYVHLAGHTVDGPRLLDSHDAPVDDEVWALYARLIERRGPLPTLIEWDAKVPPLDVVLAEADRARAILDDAAPASVEVSARHEEASA